MIVSAMALMVLAVGLVAAAGASSDEGAALRAVALVLAVLAWIHVTVIADNERRRRRRLERRLRRLREDREGVRIPGPDGGESRWT